jgi:FtsZ-binding cell division protein ZapB
LAISLTISTQSIADDPDYPNGLPFQAIEQDFDTVIEAIGDVQTDVDDLQSSVDDLQSSVDDLQSDVDNLQSSVDDLQSDVDNLQSDVDVLQSDVNDLQSDVSDLANVMEVEVVVNLAACTSLLVQCADFGYENPAEGNSSPLQLVASVRRSGVPVTGLMFEDFEFNSGVVAPGGAVVQFCTDTHGDGLTCGGSFFSESGSGGTYNMLLRPADGETWDDGLYAGSLSVGDADGNGAALVSFSID